MTESTQSGSPYDKLSPALVEAAYIEKERREITGRERYLSGAARKLDEILQDAFINEVDAIANNPELSGDELLERYSQAVANSGNKFVRRDLVETLALKDLLYPGQVMIRDEKFGQEIVFYTVADTEDTPSATPILVPVQRRYAHSDEKPSYNFALKVAFTSGFGTVNDPSEFIIGTDNIAEYVASAVGEEASAASRILQAADTLEKIEQSSNADDLRAKAASLASDELMEEVGKRYSSLYDRDDRRITDNFDTLAKVDPDGIEKVLDAFALDIAKHADTRYDLDDVESKLDFVKLYLSHRRTMEVSEDITEETTGPTTTQVFVEYATLIERGKKLLEAAQQDKDTREGDSLLFTID